MKKSADNMAERKIAIFGGTFNPVHKGHIRLAERFIDRCGFDKLIILPTAVPPHKQAPDLASGEDRYNMCRLAFEGVKNAEVSRYEIDKGGRNYTSDTLAYFKELFPEATLYFIMGTDMFLSFNEWHEPQEILKNAVLLCGIRDSSVKKDELEAFAEKELKLKPAQYELCFAEPFEISSSEIRRRIKAGEAYENALPEAVAEYIKSEGLYER